MGYGDTDGMKKGLFKQTKIFPVIYVLPKLEFS